MLAVVVICTASPSRADLPPLTVEGPDLVTSAGEVVTLRGVNLGNWLLLEPWMFGLDQSDKPGGFPDQASILSTMRERFGDERTHELMEVYRANWIKPRDFELIESFGFNAVRLPVHYSLLEDDAAPMALREDAFRWIDRAVEMAEDAGLYVILDLHGVPGGQSVDAPTGEVDQNRLWTEPRMQDRTVWLWEQLAERYADEPAVAAYDVVNEPFGDFDTNVSPVMLDLFGRIHDAIREVDPDTLIYAPGTLQGIAFYGDPASHGWSNVGFTEHAYPGLFGLGETSLAGHARFLAQWVGGKARQLDAMEVPYLVGEFNVVFDRVGGPDLMRTYFDRYNGLGWGATMWSYKIIKPEAGVGPSNWYMVTNGEPLDLSDLRTVGADELEARFRSLGTMPLAVDEELRQALTDSAGGGVELPEVEAVFDPPANLLQDWRVKDIGGATPGGLVPLGDGQLAVYGGGRDIFGRHDSFRFMYAETETLTDAGLFTRVDSLDATDRFAKAGLMLRDGLEADAAHALLHVLPDGRVVFAQRRKPGGLTEEETLSVPGLPAGLGLERDGAELVLHYTDAEGHWQTVRRDGPEFEYGQVGVAVLAHDGFAVTRAVVAVPAFGDRPPVQPLAAEDAANLLRNASFEDAQQPGPSEDQAANWNRWGDWLNRETGWTPVRDGKAILAYHHWRIEKPESAGVWQDVDGLEPGREYTFTAWANRDAGDEGGTPNDVELRLEAPQADGTLLTLATRAYPAEDLATGGDWSRLSVSAPARGTAMRVLLIVNPADEAPRAGALKFDSLSLSPAPAAEPQ